ncbi:hypothetical protein AGLY_014070 [Aphis glycines]|uniref:Transposable element P transposase-like RNase H C-terminal domain-containing protein n=1 Tax=Aphis glycines TaxID=307491 RepID=A0A6G0T4E1_APHGL|nr:hypothetical protein AGLY_014070 [Aphis glycines]
MEKSIPPCVKNWIQTLHAFKYLWNEKLKKISNFKFLIPRNINQDSIECLFGSIRSHGVRNINPTSYQFIASFKTLLINNFSSVNTSTSYEKVNIHLSLDLPTIIPKTVTSGLTIGYVSGYIIGWILKICNNCTVCKGNITQTTITNVLIKARCYSKQILFKVIMCYTVETHCG